LRTLRSLVFRFEDITAFSLALGETSGSLSLPRGESVFDGEWVLAIFEIGSRRRATAAAARGVCAAGDTHLEFERRDWERLVAFAVARSEHMRASRPVAASSSRIPTAAESSPSSMEAPPSSLLESSRVPAGARVLVVDDDASARDELCAMLADHGLQVEVAPSTETAASRVREEMFDALVLDFHAPGLDPLTFVRGIRSEPRLAPIPVLFVSGRPEASRYAVEAFASGADDFLAKPIRASELGARLFGLLRRARLARASLMGSTAR
jgi:two-component system phosphate regulon response regulator PhoB